MIYTLKVPEYSKIEYTIREDEKDCGIREGVLELTREAINYLENLTYSFSSGGKANVVDINRRYIRFKNFVGVISLPGLKISIFPKIFRNMINEKPNVVWKNFLGMLNYWVAHKFNTGLREISQSNYDLGEFDLLEILVYFYALNALGIITRYPYRTYVLVEKESPFIKGKIDFLRFIKKTVNLVSVPCRYYNYTRDNLINRAIKYTSLVLQKQVRLKQNLNLLGDIISLLSDAKLEYINVHELENLHFNRLNKQYQLIIELSKMFLKSQAPMLGNTRAENFAFLIPMEEVFEALISQVLANVLRGKQRIRKVSIQENIGYLLNTKSNRGVFRMIPDIIIETTDDRYLIIDTKYKEPPSIETRLGGWRDDIYQMHAYITHMGLKNMNQEIEGILLYPSDNESKIVGEYTIRGHQDEKIKLKIVTINIRREDLFEKPSLINKNFSESLLNLLNL